MLFGDVLSWSDGCDEYDDDENDSSFGSDARDSITDVSELFIIASEFSESRISVSDAIVSFSGAIDWRADVSLS